MKSEEVNEILSSYVSVPNDRDISRDVINACEEAIIAVEVIDKIKQSFIENKNTHGDYDWDRDFGEAVYNIICNAYGSDTDRESWVDEYKELQAMRKAFQDLSRQIDD